MHSEPNAYSARWHETFHRGYDPEQTIEEVEFLARVLPLGRVLDACCGCGRHVAGLAARGFEVVGLEREPEVVAEARGLGLDVRELDVRDIGEVEGLFDGAICMWASFGFLDEAGNDRLLAGLAAKLRPGGRLVLDVHNRDFFLPRPGARELVPGVTETKWVEGRRLRVHLDYGDGAADAFDWEIFTAGELRVRSEAQGFVCDLACAGFDESTSPSAQIPRMQLVFHRADW